MSGRAPAPIAKRGAVVRGRDVRTLREHERRESIREDALSQPTATGKFPFVRDRLMDTLEDLAPGAALPPERVLAERLGVARMTLRRVLDALARDGLVVRRHGSGTFVADPRPAQPLTMTSFTQHMLASGLRPSSRTLSFTVQPAGARLGRKLRLSPSASVLRVIRVRLADEEPVAIESLHVPEELVPGLTGEDLERGSFYELLRRRFGVVVTDAVQTIEATVTTAEESEILGVPLHSPAFLFEVTARDASGAGVEFVRSIFRGDRYKIRAEIGNLVPLGRRQRAARRPRDDTDGME
jgi:GntR family transcriptional regulator